MRLHCQGLSCKINVYKIVVLKRKVEYRMFKINENYLKLPGSYLFSDIGKKVAAYTEAHPEKEIIRLGIGDVTLPLAPAVIDRLHSAVDEMAKAETFKGYAPDLGFFAECNCRT